MNDAGTVSPKNSDPLNSRVVRWLALLAVVCATPFAGLRYNAALLDPDLWWHMRVGEWIVDHHSFPHTGLFGVLADQPWAAYSWGFELKVALLHRWFGLIALPIFLVLMQTAVGVLLFALLRRISGSFWTAWILTAATLASCFHTLSPRPVIFTTLFFTVELWLLFEARLTGNAKLLYCLPPLMLLWANFHIQFVYGVFVLGLFASEAVLRALAENRGWLPSDASAPKLAATTVIAVAVVSVAATLVGPYGFRLYGVALGYAQNTAQLSQVIEFASLSFRRPAHFFQLLLVCAACWAYGRSKSNDLFQAASLVAAALIGFRMTRDAWFACLIAAFVLAAAARARKSDAGLAADKTSFVQPLSVFVAAVLLCVLPSLGFGLRQDSMFLAIDRMYPLRATSFILDNHLPGPMYNTFDWGGYLIYNLREYPVSVDGRTDLYGEQLGTAAHDVASGFPAAVENDPYLNRANFVLVNRTYPLVGILAKDPHWQAVYADHLAVVFVRKAANAEQK